MFGVVPKLLWSRSYNEGDDRNRIPLSLRPMLVRFDGKTLLVDCGIGDKNDEKFAKIYGIQPGNIAIKDGLSAIGIKPEDIDYVILTHLHFDHSGGAVVNNNGKFQPAFPNARYYVQKKQLDWALSPTEKDKASFLPENYMPLVEHSVLETLDGNGELFPGVELITVSGHTESMQLVHLSSDGDNLLYCADLAPTAVHVKLPFVMGYDNFPLKTIEEKKQIFHQAAAENWLLFYEHDAFREMSKVVEDEKGFSAVDI
jgi:glyoxylase-like metal-dependent hydrolase (beta-lactamase superfamily II)